MLKTDHYIDTTDSYIHYEVYGGENSQTLICIQGFGYCTKHFEFQIKELSKSFRLVLIDNKDMGESKTKLDQYTIADLADDIKKVILHLGETKVSLLGISMGGFVAQVFATKYPMYLSKLILGCTTSNSIEFPKLKRMSEEDILKAYTIEEEYRNKMICYATVHPSIHKTNLFDKILSIRLQNTPKKSKLLKQLKAVNAFLDESNSIDLGAITAPTLILTGAEDRFVDPISSKMLKKRISNSVLFELPKSDHHFFMEEASLTNKTITQFIQENPCQ